MKAKDMRELSSEDLIARAATIERDVFKFRLRKVLGQLEKPMVVREARRDYARIKTLLQEREAAKETKS